MTIRNINLRDIRLDGGTQPRVEISTEVVNDYHQAFTDGAQMPPLSVYWDGASYWLADGFHRLHALRKLGALTVECNVVDGTQQEAILAACAANAHHGLRRTNADKRRAVEMVLAVAAGWSDRQIARHVGVGQPFVGAVRNPEVAAKQEVNRKASAGRKAGVKSDFTQPAGEATANPAQSSGQGSGQGSARAEAGAEGDDDMGAQIEREFQAEQLAMRQIFEADDKLAEALAIIKQRDAVIDGLNQRLLGQSRELAEAISIIKSLKRKLDKAGVKA